MWPNLPTDYHNRLVISGYDDDVQANCVLRNGVQIGVWFDDTTPHLDTYVAEAVKKYEPLKQRVFVLVPTFWQTHHQPSIAHGGPIVNLYEYYPYHNGSVPWQQVPLFKDFAGYVVQCKYHGFAGNTSPTDTQYKTILTRVISLNPEYIFLF